MTTVRILICSPGDVVDERERARQVIESLRRRYARRFVLKHLLWEDLPLQPDMPFQSGIELLLSGNGGVDIGVFILWSRLGSPVGPILRRPDGSEYRSGTEREFDLMMKARAQSGEAGSPRPDILIYRRIDENSFHENLRGQSTHEQKDLINQKNLVETFFAEEFKETRTGINLRAYHSYDRPAIFSQRLRAHLQVLLDRMAEGHPQETIWDTDTQGAPFMGLEAFEQRHADVFFGREEEILEARRALRQQARNGCAFLLLCGASGSGKSSLARAGVLPAIIENELDEQVTAWRTLIVTPFELAPDPISALVSRIAANDVLPELLGDTSAPDFVEVLRGNPKDACKLQFGAAFTRADQRNKGPVRLLLVVDQLEELFASAAIDAPGRAVFLSVLEALARNGRVWILATVRADFYEQVQNEPSLLSMKSGNGQLDILPPGADALHRLVEEPAHLAGLRFEKLEDGQSLADHILRDAAAHPELLPLVEDLLRELYERRTNDQLTFAAYETLGNSVEGALARRAERAFSDLPANAQESLDPVLQALVTLGENADNLSYTDLGATHAGGEHVVRQRAALSGFAEGSPARLLIDTFVAQRLFTAGKHPETGAAIVTVAHESLLRAWPRAVNWAENNRDFLHTRAHVAQRLKEGSPLLDGDPLLGAARDHLARNPDGFPEDLRRFVTDSVQAVADARNRSIRRSRQIYAALACAAVAVLAYILFLSYSRTQDAIAGQLVAEAERNLSQKDYARAEIAAASALTYRDTPETRRLLVDARNGGISLVSSAAENAPQSALSVFSRDGEVMAAVLDGGDGIPIAVSVSSTSDYKERWRVKLPASASPPDSIAISEPMNGVRQLAVAWSSDSATVFHVDLWRLEEGQAAGRFRELLDQDPKVGRHSKRIPSMAFHPSQPWIATSGEDTKICLWDYSGDRSRLIWEQSDTHGTAVHGIAFNKDGTLLASGGGDYRVKIWRTDEMVASPSGPIKPFKLLKGHTDSVFAVAFSPDGKRLASGGYDRIVRIWDLTLPKEDGYPTVGTLAGHEGTVLAISFSGDSKLLASGGKGKAVRLWEVSEGRLLGTITPDNGEIRSVAWLSFEDDLHVGGGNGWSTWSVRGHTMATRLWNGGATIGAIAFDSTGRYIAAGGDDGRVRIWDRKQSFRSPLVLDPRTPGESINGITFSHDGRWLAAAGEAQVIHVWDRARGWSQVHPTAEAALRHDGPVWGLCFDPQGRWLASGNTGDNKRIRRWKLDDWSLMDESDQLHDSVWSLACAPGGQRLISGDSKARVGVRETERLGVMSEKINVQQGEVNVWSVAISESPPTILSGNSDGRVRRWIPADSAWTGSSKEILAETSAEDAKVNPTINSVSYSKKHGWVAAGGDGDSVEIYDDKLQRIRGLKGHSGTVWFVSFDPQGSRLAYGGTDRILRVFDLDEMDRNLKVDTPEEIYRSSQQKTGLSVVDSKIVTRN
ncbi:MAG TPA: AAA family ATPase [Thermoanaerobaculia bacterium]|nr:AAA family ATPase [Thermoanaerobaculia bacterium]